MELCQTCGLDSDGTGGMSFILWPPVGEGTAGSSDDHLQCEQFEFDVDIMRLGSTTKLDGDGLPYGSVSEIFSPPRVAE